MPPADPARSLFELSLVLTSGPERDAWLAHACAGEPGLEERVRALIHTHETDTTLLKGLEARTAAACAPFEKAGALIGRYKLLQSIGEGGFGSVWMAEQTEPVSRRVALKIIKLGMDTREVIARFEAERQALALMDHPNIARVLDAGATDTGRPFFVMELVKGVPVTQYCDDAGLGTRERLAIFADVCAALQHAHQKGIIHRDIKPSNVLITLYADQPVVKVIDFGIAKATQGKLTDKTLFTRFEQFIGTPAYMSPEQAALSAVDIDTRSDIYSLGVLLYELLTGKPPFDARSLLSAGYDEMRRIIREVEPPKPSSRLGTVAGDERTILAKTHRIEPEKLSRLVAADLDWIVMKALDKDRTRRYETAGGLAADLARVLADEAVTARPPSAGYQFRKFARRNRTTLRVAASLAAVLVAATAVSTSLAIRATRAEAEATSEANRAMIAQEQAYSASFDLALEVQKRARQHDAEKQARQEAESILTFLTEVFQSPDPTRDGRTITVAETLDKAAAKLDIDLAAQPARRAKLQTTLGKTYNALGLFREAIPLLEKARDSALATHGPEHPDTLIALGDLANSYADIGRKDEALALREEVLAFRGKALGPEHPDTLKAMAALANSYADAGRDDEALTLGEEVLALSRTVNGPEHRMTLGAMHNLAISYEGRGRRDEAIRLREEVLALSRKIRAPAHPGTLMAMGNLANSYHDADRSDEALSLREEVLALSRTVNGPEHPDTLWAMENLAVSYESLSRGAEALKLREEALALRRRFLAPEHPDTLWAMHNLANAYENAGRKDEALTLREEVLALRRSANGPEHPDSLGARTNLALSYADAGRLDEALVLMKENLATMRRVLPASHPLLGNALKNMIDLCVQAGRADEAAVYQTELDTLK